MHFAYFYESDKYDTLRNNIQDAGYIVVPCPGGQGGDRLLIGHRDSTASFVVGKDRSQGWFVCLYGPIYYLVPDEASMAPLCIRLLKQPGIAQRHWPNMDNNIKQEFHLVEMDGLAWFLMEKEETKRIWTECGWRELSDSETDVRWATFRNWHECLLPTMKVNTVDLAWVYKLPETEFDLFEKSITLMALDALRKETSVDEEVVVYEENHNACLFNPHAHNGKVLRDYWVMPILPDVDSHYYVAQDFRLGILSDRDSRVLRVFGLDSLVIPNEVRNEYVARS